MGYTRAASPVEGLAFCAVASVASRKIRKSASWLVMAAHRTLARLLGATAGFGRRIREDNFPQFTVVEDAAMRSHRSLLYRAKTLPESYSDGFMLARSCRRYAPAICEEPAWPSPSLPLLS